jgi:hypothetical protein
VLVFRRCEEDQFHAIFSFDMSVVARRDLEKVAGRDFCPLSAVEHANDQSSREAVASMMHRTRILIAKKRFLIFLSGPAGFKNCVHPGGSGPHLDDGDASEFLYVEFIVGRFEAPSLD